MEGNLYIGLEEPTEFRREVLLCIKDMINALRLHEQYKELRTKKHEQYIKAKQRLQELNILNNKLKRSFPKIKLKMALKKAPIPQITKQKTPSKLELLEKQLDMVESQISSLK